MLSLHPETIRRAIAAGELQAANSGGKTHYRISRAAITMWWQSRGGGVLFPNPGPSLPPNPERKAAINAAYGSMRRGDGGGRVERLLAEKREDVEREISRETTRS